MSAAWAVVIIVTDQLAWPLALWIATTVGPLTALATRLDLPAAPSRERPHACPSTEPREETSNDHLN
ncbi:MAG: hypothetical protein AAGA42_20905 [Actinomycetota bacterium]